MGVGRRAYGDGGGMSEWRWGGMSGLEYEPVISQVHTWWKRRLDIGMFAQLVADMGEKRLADAEFLYFRDSFLQGKM